MLPRQVFIVEDEGVVAADLEESLRALGYHVVGKAASGEDAVSRVARLHPDIVLMDIMLRGDLDGIRAAELIRRDRDIPVVFLTAHADTATVSSACGSQPFGYILKPYSEQDLRVTLEVALHRHAAEVRLRRMERWLSTTLESIGDGVVATDREGHITFMNPQAECLTGWTASAAAGRPLGEVLVLHDASDGRSVPDPVREAVRRNEVVTLPPGAVLRTADGRVVPVDDSAAPIRDRDQVVGGVLVFRDCTERVRAEAEIRAVNEHLEQRVKDRTSELLAVNRELESFTYSVAHDLRAPLRAINGFGALLTERYRGLLDDEGRRLLGVVCDSARQMGQMVDGFLCLARVGRQALRRDVVDMRALAWSAAEEVTGHPVSATISVGDLPLAAGDASVLRQVWVNLMANAVKFSRGREEPRIEIGGEVETGSLHYWVRDNGVGFEMEFRDRLFETFQRLHAPEAFEGTGVGLAIVRRVVERHGGRVWAEGWPNRGAVFHFSLPAGEPGLVSP